LKKFILAALAALSMLFGGLVASAPASATAMDVIYTRVVFDSHHQGAPSRLYAYTSAGRYTMQYRQALNRVWKVCPIGYSRLEWWSPSGGHGVKPVATCIVFNTGQGGTWSIGTYPGSF
jgi:hypothetical protein